MCFLKTHLYFFYYTLCLCVLNAYCVCVCVCVCVCARIIIADNVWLILSISTFFFFFFVYFLQIKIFFNVHDQLIQEFCNLFWIFEDPLFSISCHLFVYLSYVLQNVHTLENIFMKMLFPGLLLNIFAIKAENHCLFKTKLWFIAKE